MAQRYAHAMQTDNHDVMGPLADSPLYHQQAHYGRGSAQRDSSTDGGPRGYHVELLSMRTC